VTDTLRALSTVLMLAIPSGVLAQEGRPEAGRAFAEANCAGCHAIGRTGESPLAAAPPFRTLHRRYPVEHLAEAFAEGIETGHEAMPAFELDEAGIADLLAYLKSLEG
jgi:cytochrome c